MYSFNIDIDALEKTNKAMALIEQLQLISEQLKDLEKTAPVPVKAEVTAISARAEALFNAVNETDSEEALQQIGEGLKLSNIAKSKIDKLGISSEIIRLRSEAKMSYSDIAKRFSLNESTVSNYCKLYDKSRPIEQAKAKTRSIMDYANTWEDLGAMIYRMLAKLENDPEHHVKYISELRQLSVVIEKFMSKQTAQQKIEQIIQINKEILLDVLPEKKQLIMERFQQVGLGKALQPTDVAFR